MKKLVICLCLLLLPCLALAEGILSVTGSAAIAPSHEEAVLHFTLTAQQETLDAALSAMDGMVAGVENTLAGKAIPHMQAQVLDTVIAPDYEQHNTRLSEKQLLVSYTVTKRLSVRLPDASLAQEAIRALLAAGINSRYEVALDPIRTGETRQAAMDAAVQDAQQRAQALSRSLGLSLEAIHSADQRFEGDTALVSLTYTVK